MSLTTTGCLRDYLKFVSLAGLVTTDRDGPQGIITWGVVGTPDQDNGQMAQLSRL
jgi:hypothetical protein